MASTGEIRTFYSDKEKTNPVFPRTKMNAISDTDGTGLHAYLNGVVYANDNETDETTSAPINADTLGGINANEFALKTELDHEHSEEYIGLRAYPVDSIYISVNSTSPASIFGGTWEQLKDRFLLGAGDTYINRETGGEATNTLTINEMPNHRHNFIGDGTKIIQSDSSLNKAGTAYTTRASISIGADWSSNGYVTLSTVGNGAAHNNMPPYLVVYMWKRTA